MWVIAAFVFIPVFTHIAESQECLMASTAIECPPNLTSNQAKPINVQMESLVQRQSTILWKTFELWIGTLFIMLSTMTFFIYDFTQEMERI